MLPMENAKRINSIIKSFIISTLYEFTYANIMQNQLVDYI
jgi:hypothetical protein